MKESLKNRVIAELEEQRNEIAERLDAWSRSPHVSDSELNEMNNKIEYLDLLVEEVKGS